MLNEGAAVIHQAAALCARSHALGTGASRIIGDAQAATAWSWRLCRRRVMAGASDARGRLAGLSVLFVDDDEDTRDVIGAFLDHHGARVRLARDASEALAELAVESADVFVSDYTMPGMTGIELLDRVRMLPNGAAPIPAILYTAVDSLHAAARAAGFEAYLVKPIDPRRLVEVIARVARV